MTLEQKIEAVLFYKAEPMKFSQLAELFDVGIEDVMRALEALNTRLAGGATQVTSTDTSAQLVISSAFAEIIEALRKEDIKRDIGKAGAETLAIVLYKGPLSRAEIDKIRGVNSTFILRNLLVRGLIERRDNPKDQRSFLYAATPDLLNHLGIARREELQDFSDMMNTLDAYEKEHAQTVDETNSLA